AEKMVVFMAQVLVYKQNLPFSLSLLCGAAWRIGGPATIAKNQNAIAPSVRFRARGARASSTRPPMQVAHRRPTLSQGSRANGPLPWDRTSQPPGPGQAELQAARDADRPLAPASAPHNRKARRPSAGSQGASRSADDSRDQGRAWAAHRTG